jgi:carboxypeptidase C (cathepsin A)
MWYLLLLLSSFLFAEPIDTLHSLQTKEGPLSYTATTNSLPLRDDKGKVVGQIYYTAYTLNGADLATRPITFAFNGGPGCSSQYLHLGAIGPKRILTPEEGQSVVPPYRWIDNEATLLDRSDLIFIDPIGTGYSRMEGEADPLPYWSMEGDIAATAQFIRDYLTSENRWLSPKYLMGESYGTLRAAGLAGKLQTDLGIYLNGVIFVSSAIDFAGLDASNDNFFPFLFLLPTAAATAHYHGRLPRLTLEQAVNEAREFAYYRYAPALLLGQELELTEPLSLFTGLPLDAIESSRARIDLFSLIYDFFSTERKMIGAYDTRTIGDRLPGISWSMSLDPSIYQIDGILSGTLNAYLRQELRSPLLFPAYSGCSAEAFLSWDWPKGEIPNQMDALRQAMIQNNKLKVFVACGFYDAVTPFMATEYLFRHLLLPETYTTRVRFGYYEGGHMFYTNPNARLAFKEDLSEFYD